MIRILNYILTFLLLVTLASCTNSGKDGTDRKEKQSIKVMAYYVPEKDFKPEQIPVEQLTHIIYSFTNVIEGEMKFRDPEVVGPKLKALVGQKSRNPDLKVMIACGGWGANGFSDMASTAENRARFIESARAFIEIYELDGLDIDWEYPTIPAAGTGARDEDKENFTLLMKGLRETLDEMGRPQTLTFASAGWEHYYDNVEIHEVMKYADYMNVMTYDQVSGNSIHTGHHTPLGAISVEELQGTPFKNNLDKRTAAAAEKGQKISTTPGSAEKIVKYLIAEGINLRQIVIGAAFYGRIWKGVPPENNGLYQLSKGIHTGWSTYKDIRNTFEPDPGFARYWDENAKAPYMYNHMDSIFISYDDTVSVALKTQYAVNTNLGGIMFWELGNDTKEDGSLLEAIHGVANNER